MPRVYELAKELGVSSKDVLERLTALGSPAKSHSSGLDDATADRVRVAFRNGDVPEVEDPLRLGGLSAAVTESLDVRGLPRAADGAAGRGKEGHKRLTAHLAELPVLLFVAFAIAVLVKTLLVQAFYIPSGSMFPTLHIGDRVLVEKVSYRFHGPRRGDVVVFARSVFGDPPDLPWHEDARNYVRELLGMRTGSGEEDYIKRIVALEGEAIRYVGTPRRLYIDGRPVEEPYIRRGLDRTSSAITRADCVRLDMEKSDDGCLVPAGMVFVMGDNRANSSDSRSIGPVSEDKIVGRAFVIIWPPSDVGLL